MRAKPTGPTASTHLCVFIKVRDDLPILVVRYFSLLRESVGVRKKRDGITGVESKKPGTFAFQEEIVVADCATYR